MGNFGQAQDNSARTKDATGGQFPFKNMRTRKGGGYEADVTMPNGIELTLNMSSQTRFVSEGTAYVQARNGDPHKLEITAVSGDPKKEHTPIVPEEHIQNPENPAQRMGINGNGAYIRTDGKPLMLGDNYSFDESTGILKSDKVSVDLKTGEVKGVKVTLNLNTGEISGDLTLNGTISATGAITAPNIP